MKVLTIESLRTFLEELERRYGKETYSKQEIDEKLKSNGGSVDLKGLAERIPSWQWKVTLPKTEFGIVTATVGGIATAKSEKDKEVSFYAPQGSIVKFAIEQRYESLTAGEMSATEVTLTSDFTLTVKKGACR